MKKSLTTHDIINKYNELTAPAKVSVLTVALDFMQQYNGRSKSTCIALAMGYVVDNEGNWIKE